MLVEASATACWIVSPKRAWARRVLRAVDESVLGQSIAIQVKSGPSYCTKPTCKIASDREHVEYWQNRSLVVLGMFLHKKAPKIKK